MGEKNLFKVKLAVQWVNGTEDIDEVFGRSFPSMILDLHDH